MKTSTLLLLFFTLGCPTHYAQMTAKGKKPAAKPSAGSPGFQMDVLKASALEIKAARPQVSSKALACDRSVISEALPKITTQFVDQGFTQMDSTQAVADGWIFVRVSSPLQPERCMHKDSFEKFVGNLGKVVFSSTPSVAAIELDGRDLNRSTTHTKWLPPKTYNVKYSKDGYEDAEITCEAVERKPSECHADLTKKD